MKKYRITVRQTRDGLSFNSIQIIESEKTPEVGESWKEMTYPPTTHTIIKVTEIE